MKRTIEYIEAIICAEEKIMPNDLRTKNIINGKLRRFRIFSEIRQYVMYFSQLVGYEPRIAANYYGFDRCTALHAKKHINNLIDSNKKFAVKMMKYSKIIEDGKLYQLDTLRNSYDKLCREVDELANKLKEIKL
jgi:hypothetical protein